MRNRRTRQRGFTIIEVMLVTLIMGVLAALVMPTIRVNTARAKISEVIGMFGTCRNTITEIYLYESDLPTANNWGCESVPGNAVSQYVDQIETTLDGIIVAHVNRTGDLRLDWHKLTLAPLDSNGNLMSTTGRVARWRCGNEADGTDVPFKLRPSSCNGG